MLILFFRFTGLSRVRHAFQLQYRLFFLLHTLPVARRLRGAEGLGRHLVPTLNPLGPLRPLPHDTDQHPTTPHHQGPALCLDLAALRCTANRPSVPLRTTDSSNSALKTTSTPRQQLSLSNCTPTFTPFMRLWSECVPAIQVLAPEHQHNLARVICNLAPPRRPPPVIARLAADLRSIAIEIIQCHSFQDCYASDLQAALDVGEPRSGTTTKASFVPHQCTVQHS